MLLQRVLLQRVPPRVHAQPQVAHSLSTKAGADSSGVAGEDAHHSHRAHIPGESQHRLRLAQKNVDLLPGLEETLVALDGHPDEVIVDEMWTFIGQKDNTAWVWIALSRRNLQIIGFHIGRRSLDDARQLWQQLPGSCGNRCPAVVATGARALEEVSGVHRCVSRLRTSVSKAPASTLLGNTRTLLGNTRRKGNQRSRRRQQRLEAARHLPHPQNFLFRSLARVVPQALALDDLPLESKASQKIR